VTDTPDDVLSAFSDNSGFPDLPEEMIPVSGKLTGLSVSDPEAGQTADACRTRS